MTGYRSKALSGDYEDDGVFVIVAEGAGQGPIIMETEGADTSRDSAMDRVGSVPWAHRYCVARLTFVSGNELLFHDIKRMQK